MHSELSEGVLLLAHGSVEALDELPEFLLKIRHGRAPSAELLSETRRRYELIGGKSPLLAATRAQAQLLAERLSCPVFVGMRLWQPSIESALLEASSRGVRRLCLLPLAPFSVAVYVTAALQARDRLQSEQGRLAAPELYGVAPFGSWPSFVEVHARVLLEALAGAEPDKILISAHSLPQAVIRSGDGYARELTAFVRALEARVERPLSLVYQSQGADGGAWLEPTLKAALEECRGLKVLLYPAGFMTEHIETLYDLDIEAQQWAGELGIQLQRLPTLGSHPQWIDCMAELVRTARTTALHSAAAST